MTDIVLSNSVRQSLSSLQATAKMLDQTQTRLATGNRVNSALDNPTNFFTAQGLNSRAGDLTNLLDSVSNGIQVLQAANTGLTSLQKLVDTAKSVANQALQTSSGYSSRASVLISGSKASPSGTATATNLNSGKLAGAVIEFRDNAGNTTTLTVGATASALSGGAATVTTLDEVNTALKAAGISLTASFDATEGLLFESSPDAAGQVITTAGTAPTSFDAIDIKAKTNTTAGTVTAAVADAASQTIRANLLSQYNQILQQIRTTSQDASFNGANLLNGDDLKLTFNETGRSSVTISGFMNTPANLGLSTLTAGVDFIDNKVTNKVLASLQTASNTLRTQSSTLGSNLQIVQIREDFSKNLINVLKSGATYLTIADSNEEAANSQALSTRQSIAVSALSLANQAQQGILRLLQ